MRDFQQKLDKIMVFTEYADEFVKAGGAISDFKMRKIKRYAPILKMMKRDKHFGGVATNFLKVIDCIEDVHKNGGSEAKFLEIARLFDESEALIVTAARAVGIHGFSR